jgi:hypothetical protein
MTAGKNDHLKSQAAAVVAFAGIGIVRIPE